MYQYLIPKNVGVLCIADSINSMTDGVGVNACPNASEWPLVCKLNAIAWNQETKKPGDLHSYTLFIHICIEFPLSVTPPPSHFHQPYSSLIGSTCRKQHYQIASIRIMLDDTWCWFRVPGITYDSLPETRAAIRELDRYFTFGSKLDRITGEVV